MSLHIWLPLLILTLVFVFLILVSGNVTSNFFVCDKIMCMNAMKWFVSRVVSELKSLKSLEIKKCSQVLQLLKGTQC